MPIISEPQIVVINSLGDRELISYERFVGLLCKPLPYADHLNHMVIGIAGEAGELADCVKKYTIYEKALDLDNLKEELGDLLWYIQGVMVKQGWSWEEVLQYNADKLMVRYGKMAYSNADAIARNDKQQDSGESQLVPNAPVAQPRHPQDRSGHTPPQYPAPTHVPENSEKKDDYS